MRHLHHPIHILRISQDPLKVLQHHHPLDIRTQLADFAARIARATADVNNQRRLLVTPRLPQPLGKWIQANSPDPIKTLRLHGHIAVSLSLRELRDIAPAFYSLSPVRKPAKCGTPSTPEENLVCAYVSSATSTRGPEPGAVAQRRSRTRSAFSTTTGSWLPPAPGSRDSRTSAVMGVPSAGSAEKTPMSRRHLRAVARHTDPRRPYMTPVGPWTSASSFSTSTARASWAAASVALLLLLLLAALSRLFLEVSA
ncbi:hypothetical protein VSDG_06405 [Cytospora chrysosperma]|uniref:Uncharacterized protein n=1 Tax=Cytospora chrysosperma TaxID=252740 RepID=A0A423VPK0_CYTCH|nr:hypothetical protein VSDG_06405 [Valsa sordida]